MTAFRPSRRNATIMLVEDDANDILLTQRAFEKGGLANPLVVMNRAEEAWAHLMGEGPYADRGEHPFPALALLDIKMPGMNGLELLEKIRAAPVLKRLPVIMLTSSSEEIDVTRACDSGVNSYLVKPVRFEEFVRILQQVEVYWLVVNVLPEL